MADAVQPTFVRGAIGRPAHAVVEQDPHDLGNPFNRHSSAARRTPTACSRVTALKVFNELAERLSACEIVPQVFDRHTGPVKTRRAADPLRVHPYQPVKRVGRRDELVFVRIRLYISCRHSVAFSPSELWLVVRSSVIVECAARCREVESGARNVDHILTGSLLPEMSREFLAKLAEGQTVSKAHIGLGDDGAFVYAVE